MLHFQKSCSDSIGLHVPRTFSVLVVDNESLQIDAVMRQLKREKRIGIRASASSAESALRLIDRGVRFDLIITDYHMDGMTGASLAIALRQRSIETPIILCSAAASHAEIAESGAEFSAFIRKGDEYATLLMASVRDQLGLDKG